VQIYGAHICIMYAMFYDTKPLALRTHENCILNDINLEHSAAATAAAAVESNIFFISKHKQMSVEEIFRQAHTHTHTCAHTHVHTHTDRRRKNIERHNLASLNFSHTHNNGKVLHSTLAQAFSFRQTEKKLFFMCHQRRARGEKCFPRKFSCALAHCAIRASADCLL
jgi:hypothetical protein